MAKWKELQVISIIFRKLKKDYATVWHVVEADIELFEPNENDDLPQRLSRDVEGTTTLWEEEYL
jgi:hypothetical protein